MRNSLAGKAVAWALVLGCAFAVGQRIGHHVAAGFYGHAHAGEGGLAAAPGLLGTIRTDDAGTISNIDTGYGNGLAGAVSVPFSLSVANQRLTIQCDQAAYVLTDVYGVDAGNGLQLAALEKLTTSINSTARTGTKLDGGTFTSGLVSIAPVSGPTAVCKVWTRTGAE